MKALKSHEPWRGSDKLRLYLGMRDREKSIADKRSSSTSFDITSNSSLTKRRRIQHDNDGEQDDHQFKMEQENQHSITSNSSNNSQSYDFPAMDENNYIHNV